MSTSKRHCIGRKPVTDFTVNEWYTGTVKYVKDFGLFADIGSHSDAFVHVSRVRDGFIDDIHSIVKDGDEVKLRIVEIDRAKKRLTGSMQSEAMIEEEKKSMEAMKERKNLKKKGNKTSKTSKTSATSAPKVSTAEQADVTTDQIKISPPPRRSAPKSNSNSTGNNQDAALSRQEEKRQAKIARRAARRAEAEGQ